MNKEFLSLVQRVAETALDNAQQVLGDYKSSAMSRAPSRAGREVAYEKDVAEALELLKEIARETALVAEVANMQQHIDRALTKAENQRTDILAEMAAYSFVWSDPLSMYKGEAK